MNSIFPFTVDEAVQPGGDAGELPVFRELAYDYEHNCLKRRGGKPYCVEKDEALQIWVFKALLSKRFIWPAYTHAYGSETENLIGFSNSQEIVDSEARRYITEALMVNPYIQELSMWSFRHEGAKLTVEFLVTTVYGRFTHESEVYNE